MAPASNWEGAPKNASPRKKRRRIRAAVIGALLVCYAAGTYYFSSHLTPGTTVDGVDAGMLTQDQLVKALDEREANYTQHITNADGFDLSITGTDISLSGDTKAVASEAFSRSTAALWPLSLLTPQHMLVDAKVSIDEDALGKIVNEAVDAYNSEAQAPTDAAVRFDDEQGIYVIDEESIGTAIEADPIIDACALASRELREDVTLGAEAYKQPQVTKDDERLTSAVDKANGILTSDFHVTHDGENVATFTPAMMREWLYLDDDLELSVDGDGILSYVNDSEELTDAGNITDDEHVWILDPVGTADAAYKAIRDGKDSSEIALTLIETKPEVTPGAKERGRHIDVNLSTQFARFYDTDGTVIWDSYFVSGNVAEGRQTPTGEFAIEAKETGRTLVGADENNDGKPDYESFVNYWMPFLAGDWGLHDATWRWDGEFGGTTYQWNGSHGCINLPFAKAEELYGLCKVGDPVIVHY